jgi:fimbrial chaperone protein
MNQQTNRKQEKTVTIKGVNVRTTRAITRGLLAGALMIATMGFTARAEAGVALGATRVIYPAGQKQVQLAVTNNDERALI